MMVFFAGAGILCMTGMIFNEKSVTDDMRVP
jgi:hypothetical protein